MNDKRESTIEKIKGQWKSKFLYENEGNRKFWLELSFNEDLFINDTPKHIVANKYFDDRGFEEIQVLFCWDSNYFRFSNIYLNGVIDYNEENDTISVYSGIPSVEYFTKNNLVAEFERKKITPHNTL